jgi:hypothetical protein
MDQELESRIGLMLAWSGFTTMHMVPTSIQNVMKKRLYGGNNIVCIQCLLLICGGIIGHVESQNWVVVALGQWSYYIRVFHMR